MSYMFSKRSLNNLKGVSPDLVRVAYKSLVSSSFDFGIIQGLRDAKDQEENVKNGSSQTRKSKHLTGNAIDVVAYEGASVKWVSGYYIEIANAFAKASKELDIAVRWGGAWNVYNIGDWGSDMGNAHDFYLIDRKTANKKPFNDFGHFELN